MRPIGTDKAWVVTASAFLGGGWVCGALAQTQPQAQAGTVVSAQVQVEALEVAPTRPHVLALELPASARGFAGASAVSAEVMEAPGANAGDAPDLALACHAAQAPKVFELAQVVSAALQDDPAIALAQAEVSEARAQVLAAQGAFLPQGVAAYQNQHYVPDDAASPVVVVGNTVLGGSQTNSAYGSLALSLNVFDSGKDIANLRGAKAGRLAADSGLDAQVDDTLSKVLQAYSDLFEAQVLARQQAATVTGLRAIEARAQERYAGGQGSVIALGQARDTALSAQQTLNQNCRELRDKAATLAQAAGIQLPLRQWMAVTLGLPAPDLQLREDLDLQEIIESDAGVTARREKVTAAQAGLTAAERAFGPTFTLSVRRDFLGQSVDDLGEANRHIGPYDYQVGLSFQQQLFPFNNERAGVQKARAEVRRSEAQLTQARLDAQKALRQALSARDEADASWESAREGLEESQRVLTLTQSLYAAGRTDLDSVEHAQLDRDKARAAVVTLGARRTAAAWAVARTLGPREFAGLIRRQLRLASTFQ